MRVHVQRHSVSAFTLYIHSLHSLFTFTRSSVVFLYSVSALTLHTHSLHSRSFCIVFLYVVFLQKVFLLFDYCLLPAARRAASLAPRLAPGITYLHPDALQTQEGVIQTLQDAPRRDKTFEDATRRDEDV